MRLFRQPLATNVYFWESEGSTKNEAGLFPPHFNIVANPLSCYPVQLFAYAASNSDQRRQLQPLNLPQ